MTENIITLFRPVNDKELELIKASDYNCFPPRLPEQPIFYPVLNEEYAVQISRDWNLPAYGVGYVVRFKIDAQYFSKFKIQNVGGPIHNEIWVPAEELAEFNKHIIGKIELIMEFR